MKSLGFLTGLKSYDPDNIELVLSENISAIISKPHDLLLISLDGWHKYHKDRRATYIPSALVIKP